MTPVSKKVPESVENSPTFQAFLKSSQERLDAVAKKEGKEAPTITLDSITVENKRPDDGVYLFVYKNQDLDLVLAGKVYARRHEMHLFSMHPKAGSSPVPFEYVEMEDACTLTRAVASEEELGEGTCQDGVVDPRIMEAKGKYDSLTRFEEYCQDAYKKHLETVPDYQKKGSFSLSHTEVFNPDKGNRQWLLRYENPVNDFICQGMINLMGQQIMGLGHGKRSEYGPGMLNSVEGFVVPPEKVVPMNDACRLTDDLVGAEEHHNNCKEFSQDERDANALVGGAWDVAVDVATYLGIYKTIDWASLKITKLGNWNTAWHDKSFGRINGFVRGRLAPGWQAVRSAPGYVYRNGIVPGWQSLRTLPGRAWSGVRPAWGSFRSVMGNAYRYTVTYGPRLLSGAGTLLTRYLPRFALAGGGTATAAETGGVALATEGGAAATAGGGSIGLLGQGALVLGAFVVGAGVGVGIEKGSQAVFGAGPSDGIAYCLEGIFGKASDSSVEWGDKWLGWVP